MLNLPYIGHGVGLRTQHYGTVVDEHPAVDWLEVISENFMVAGGNPRRVLRRVRERYPIVLHGVSLSIGSADPLDAGYLDDLAMLARETEPAWVSDHLCWSSVGGHYSHDLLPLPYTEEALAHVVQRVQRVQEKLERQILIENVSSYVTFTQSSLTEWQFLAELCTRADCGLLLDVNNVFVSAFNHGFAPDPPHLLATHDHAVCDGVWALYRRALKRFGRLTTLVEWDDHIPPFDEVLAESKKAAAIEREVLDDVAA
jgi:uncharacterized protein (UPF0276 family)